MLGSVAVACVFLVLQDVAGGPAGSSGVFGSPLVGVSKVMTSGVRASSSAGPAADEARSQELKETLANLRHMMDSGLSSGAAAAEVAFQEALQSGSQLAVQIAEAVGSAAHACALAAKQLQDVASNMAAALAANAGSMSTLGGSPGSAGVRANSNAAAKVSSTGVKSARSGFDFPDLLSL